MQGNLLIVPSFPGEVSQTGLLALFEILQARKNWVAHLRLALLASTLTPAKKVSMASTGQADTKETSSMSTQDLPPKDTSQATTGSESNPGPLTSKQDGLTSSSSFPKKKTWE